MAILSKRTAKLAATTALCSLIGLSALSGATAIAREAGVAAAVNTDATSIPPAKVERTLIVGNRVVFEETVRGPELIFTTTDFILGRSELVLSAG